MTTIELDWKAADGTPIFAREWKPQTHPRAVVVLIHGLGEHSGRYHHVGAAMNAESFTMLAPDLRGHGCSGGKRGHIPSYDVVCDDIQQAFTEASHRYRDLPLFLYGHSLGGALVLYYALKRKPDLCGLIASSPGLAVSSKVSKGKLAVAKVLRRLAPTVTLTNDLDIDKLSHDPSVKAAYLGDKLVHPMISAKLSMDLFDNGAWILGHKGRFPTPLLLLTGTEDKIVDSAASRQFAEGLTGDVTYREWQGLYHELHNEVDKEDVLRVITDWIQCHLG